MLCIIILMRERHEIRRIWKEDQSKIYRHSEMCFTNYYEQMDAMSVSV